MFKIQPIQDRELQSKYAGMCGATAKDGYFAYAMIDDTTDQLMGFSQFEISDGYAYISDIKPLMGRDDFEAMFILGRATMNFIDMCGIRAIKADANTAEPSFLKALGFTEAKGIFTADTTGMFDGKCHH